MLLILILAAALCLRAFAWSDKQSLYYRDRDRGMVELQSAAEVLKAHGGDFSAAAASYGGSATQTQWVLEFDENWNITGPPVRIGFVLPPSHVMLIIWAVPH